MFQGKKVVGGGVMMAVVNGTPITVMTDNKNYGALKKAFNDNDADEFVRLYQDSLPKDFLEQAPTLGVVVDKYGNVTYKGEPLHNVVVDTIKRLHSQGFNYDSVVKFLDNLMQNPSKRAIDEGFKFLEVCQLTLTEDGCFLAYKAVRQDWMDKYSGTVSNKIGEKPRMERNKVDDDCNRTCSQGYHVGALAYSGPGGWYHNSGDRVVIVKVNPADIVSVPADHSSQKLRCCGYEVIAEYNGPLTQAQYSGKVGEQIVSYPNNVTNNDNDEDYDDNWELYPEDMLEGCEYSFDYKGKRRFGLVTNFDENTDTLTVLLTQKDPSFDAEDTNYRSFSLDNISNIQEL